MNEKGETKRKEKQGKGSKKIEGYTSCRIGEGREERERERENTFKFSWKQFARGNHCKKYNIPMWGNLKPPSSIVSYSFLEGIIQTIMARNL